MLGDWLLIMVGVGVVAVVCGAVGLVMEWRAVARKQTSFERNLNYEHDTSV